MYCLAEALTVAYFYGAIIMFVTIASDKRGCGNLLVLVLWCSVWPVAILVVLAHALICALRESRKGKRAK